MKITLKLSLNVQRGGTAGLEGSPVGEPEFREKQADALVERADVFEPPELQLGFRGATVSNVKGARGSSKREKRMA